MGSNSQGGDVRDEEIKRRCTKSTQDSTITKFLVINAREASLKATRHMVLELWLHWLSDYITINPDTGNVGGYLEEILPGWLLLQLSRGLAPMAGDYWVAKRSKCLKFTSVAFINLLRRKSSAGYLVDELSYERWLSVISYTAENFKPFIHYQGDEMDPDKIEDIKNCTYQLLSLSQIQPGINSNWRWWIPLDLNKMCYFL